MPKLSEMFKEPEPVKEAPPMAPKSIPKGAPKRLPPRSTTPESTIKLNETEAKKIVDNELIRQAISSDKKRDRYYTITGRTWRGSNAELDIKLAEFMLNAKIVRENPEEIKIVREIIEIGRGTRADNIAVVAELKEVLAKRKVIVEDETDLVSD